MPVLEFKRIVGVETIVLWRVCLKEIRKQPIYGAWSFACRTDCSFPRSENHALAYTDTRTDFVVHFIDITFS